MRLLWLWSGARQAQPAMNKEANLAAHAADLRARLNRAAPVLHAGRAGDSGCRVRPAVPGTAGAGGRAPRTGHARFAHPPRGWRHSRQPAAGAARGAHAQHPHRDRHHAQGRRGVRPARARLPGQRAAPHPAQATDERYRAEPLGPEAEGHPGGRASGLRGRAQVRRPGHQLRYEDGRAGAGRHARRRRDGRRRDAEHPHCPPRFPCG